MTKVISSFAAALAVGIGLTGMGVTAASAANEFRGNACIIAMSPACAAIGWSLGSCGQTRFAPPNWNGNPNVTRMSFFWDLFSQNLTYN